MGRKRDLDRRGRVSYPKQTWEDYPQRAQSRTRSPSPARRREDVAGPLRRQRSVYSMSRSPPPSRGRAHVNPQRSSAGFDRPPSRPARNTSRSPSPRRRRDMPKSHVNEKRRTERSVSPERTTRRYDSQSRSPSPYREKSRSKKWKKKPRQEKISFKSREGGNNIEPAHRPHDIWKPGHGGDSPPPSRGRARSSYDSPPRRTITPSPRRDRPTASGSSRQHYSHPSQSPGYDRRDQWPASKTGLPPRSPAHRISQRPPDDYSPVEYERPLPPSQTRQLSPVPRRHDDFTAYPQDYNRQEYDQRKPERPPRRPRGQDYRREDWSEPSYVREKSVPEKKYYEYPEPVQPAHAAYEKYPARADPRYPEPQEYPEIVPRGRTPEGPRSHYEKPYRQYSYENRSAAYEYPPREENPRPPSPAPYPQYNQRYEEGYPNEPERYQEPRRDFRSRSQDTPIPQVPPPNQNGNTLPIPPMSTATPAPSVNGGIKPFTLKGNVLKNLKRTHEPDLESERIFKSSRVSPRHTNATSAAIMPPPPPIEVQQTQTPETPSNREGIPERRVATKEKGASMFQRIGQVGEGTYGKVYKARNTLTGELVALKKIRMESERDGFPITAMREIKLLESLRHENIIHLQEMMFEKTFVYMVFEYMDHDLAGILTHPNFTFPESHIKELLRQMLEGLHYLHHRGILHRDIKGSNILLNAEGQLKLADFGLARHYHKRRDNLDYTNRVITLWYRPPELLLGATAYGPAVDIWSIGCIMLEMVTKKAAFPGMDEIDQLSRIWEIMGSPTRDNWPKVTELPWWELVKPPTAQLERFHEDFSKVLSKEGLDLAFGLLALDPERRPSAAEALKHPYFTRELPRPERPTGLVKMDGEWHEFESKQRKRAQKAAMQEARRQSQITTEKAVEA